MLVFVSKSIRASWSYTHKRMGKWRNSREFIGALWYLGLDSEVTSKRSGVNGVTLAKWRTGQLQTPLPHREKEKWAETEPTVSGLWKTANCLQPSGKCWTKDKATWKRGESFVPFLVALAPPPSLAHRLLRCSLNPSCRTLVSGFRGSRASPQCNALVCPNLSRGCLKDWCKPFISVSPKTEPTWGRNMTDIARKHCMAKKDPQSRGAKGNEWDIQLTSEAWREFLGGNLDTHVYCGNLESHTHVSGTGWMFTKDLSRS